jgi:tRNA (guanine37-N1)-methyltransferase
MKPSTLRQALKKKLSAKQLSLARTSYDMIGDIAILEIPDELKSKQKVIADTLLNLHSNINVVVKKASQHSGTFRLQKYTILAGEKRKHTIHKENNVFLELDIEKCYFSPRLATERKRVFEKVRKGEKILIMFDGVAPYACTIEKNKHPSKITGIEINPTAHKYGEKNILRNKLSNITLHKGNVTAILPKLKEKFDRILMPLPKGAETFLPLIWKHTKKGTIVHFYDFEHEEDIKLGETKAKNAAKTAKKRIKINETIKCGAYGPGRFRICVDFKLL